MPLFEEDIEKINWGYSLAHCELCDLILLMLSFSNSLQEEGREKSYDYFFYGVLRRTYNIKRCLENFKRISPPERNEYLDDDQRNDLTLFFHAFLLHIAGGIDNLAWSWYYVKGIDSIEKTKNFRHKICLFNRDFQQYLDPVIVKKCSEFHEWFVYLKSYRDPIAHRIPPYIVPYTVDPKNRTKHNELLESLNSIKCKIGEEEKHTIQKKLDSMRDYEPIYTHSFLEDDKIMRFHPQVISDARSFCQLAKLVVGCLWT